MVIKSIPRLKIFIIMCALVLTSLLNAQTTAPVDWSNAGLWTDGVTVPTTIGNIFQVHLMSGADWDEKVLNAKNAARSYLLANPGEYCKSSRKL